MEDSERTRLLVTIQELTTMLNGVLHVVNSVLDACEGGAALTAAQLAELRQHSKMLEEKIARLQKMAATLDPPERLH
jgi:cell division protein FtsB